MIHDEDPYHTHQIVYLTAAKKACRVYTYNVQDDVAMIQPVTPFHTPTGEVQNVSLDDIQHLNAKYVWWHQGDVYLQTNVPWLVRHHSPTGMNAGYGGSGPADFALNILQWRLSQDCWSHLPHDDHVTLWDGQALKLAYRLHQDFKWQFLADSDVRQTGQIELTTIDQLIVEVAR